MGVFIMIMVRIIMNSLPEKRKEVLQTLLSLIEPIRQGKGCRSYHVFQDIENDNIFCQYSEWESQKDLEHHLRSECFSVLLGSEILLNQNQKIQIHTVSHTDMSENINAVIRG